MIVSNIRRMSESAEVEGEGTAVAGSTNSLAIVSPVEEEGGGAISEYSNL